MKKYLIMAAFAAAFVAVSCSKEQNNDVQQPVEVGQPIEAEQITITATIPAELSKVAMDYTGDALDLTWSVGDKIIVADHSNPSGNKQEFTLSSGEGSKSATFTGTAVSASSYDISLTSNWPANILAQVQSEDASTAHLGYSMTLSGVNTYKDISFNSTWASSNGGGSFTQSGALHLCAILPDEVVEKVNMVTIVADQPIFGGGIGTMTIALTTPADNNNTNNLDVFASIPASGVTIPANTGLLFKFGTTDASHSVYTRYYKVSSTPLILAGGQVNKIYLTADNADKYAGKADEGTEEKPFLIGDKYQLISLMNKYKSDDDGDKSVKYWVKLVDDIDLDGVDWVPFNRTEGSSNPFGRQIDFDGQGHTIFNLTVGDSYKYPSFIGVLYGSIKDVTFDTATIEGKEQTAAGVVAAYIGTGTKVGNCSGVTVKDVTVSGEGGSKNVGCFGAIVNAAGTISNCHVIGTNSVTQSSTESGRSAGGFVANVNAAATLTNCTAVADVTNESSYYTGGFVGQAGSEASTFTSCAFKGGTISSSRNATGNSPIGGFIGRMNYAGATFTNCYVEGATISADKCGRLGGFIGDSNTNNTYTNCYVKDIVINSASGQRVGGFVGNSNNNSCTYTSCYVNNVTLSGATNTGGFAGVFYSRANKCYVDGGTLTAKGADAGGFVGYPQKANINNCYVTSSVTVVGGTYNYVGGFVGICKDNNTVSNCYEAATVSGTGTGVGAFIGYVDPAPTSVTKCIAWNASLGFYGALADPSYASVITNNYTGTTGTISSQATTLGWDGSIWDLTGSVPTLK